MPANILIGHLDVFRATLLQFGMGLTNNKLIVLAVRSILEQEVPDEDAEDYEPTIEMKKAVAELKEYMLALVALTGGLGALRDDLAEVNDIGSEPQHLTAAYGAEMIEMELMSDNSIK